MHYQSQASEAHDMQGGAHVRGCLSSRQAWQTCIWPPTHVLQCISLPVKHMPCRVRHMYGAARATMKPGGWVPGHSLMYWACMHQDNERVLFMAGHMYGARAAVKPEMGIWPFTHALL